MQTSLADLSLMVSLDVEVPQYTTYNVRIKKVVLSLQGGNTNTLSDVDTTASHSPGDQLSYLYKATPDLGLDGAPALGGKGHVLTLNIEADVIVSDDCQPNVAIQWKTAIDFTSEQQLNDTKAANRLRSASHAGSVSSPDALLTHDKQEANAPSNAINVTLTISGPPSVRVGELFNWDVFIINRSDKIRKLAILVIPKRKQDAHRPQSSQSSIGGHSAETKELVATAVLDENIVYARQKNAKTRPTELVCLTTDIRLGCVTLLQNTRNQD